MANGKSHPAKQPIFPALVWHKLPNFIKHQKNLYQTTIWKHHWYLRWPKAPKTFHTKTLSFFVLPNSSFHWCALAFGDTLETVLVEVILWVFSRSPTPQQVLQGRLYLISNAFMVLKNAANPNAGSKVERNPFPGKLQLRTCDFLDESWIPNDSRPLLADRFLWQLGLQSWPLAREGRFNCDEHPKNKSSDKPCSLPKVPRFFHNHKNLMPGGNLPSTQPVKAQSFLRCWSELWIDLQHLEEKFAAAFLRKTCSILLIAKQVPNYGSQSKKWHEHVFAHMVLLSSSLEWNHRNHRMILQWRHLSALVEKVASKVHMYIDLNDSKSEQYITKINLIFPLLCRQT